MSQKIDITSEPFTELLAEALRAGPASPAWRQAVEALQAAGQSGEEQALLCRAREDLESGRQYRTIHAGQGFTRKLMRQIDSQKAPRWRLPTATMIAILSGAVVLVVVGLLASLVINPSGPKTSASDMNELFFVATVLNQSFDSSLPESFKPIGQIPLVEQNGVRLELRPKVGAEILGGGAYYGMPLPAARSYALDASIQVTDRKSDQMAQVFLTDQPNFSADKGISPHELVLSVQDGVMRVILPDGKTTAQQALSFDVTGTATLRVKFNREFIIVEHSGRAIYSGRHNLNGNDPRYMGFRFLTRGGDANPAVGLRWIRVMEPQK